MILASQFRDETGLVVSNINKKASWAIFGGMVLISVMSNSSGFNSVGNPITLDDEKMVEGKIEGTYSYSHTTSEQGQREFEYVSIAKGGKCYHWKHSPEHYISALGQNMKEHATGFETGSYKLKRGESGQWIISGDRLEPTIVYYGRFVSIEEYQLNRVGIGDYSPEGNAMSQLVRKKVSSEVISDEVSVGKYHGCVVSKY